MHIHKIALAFATLAISATAQSDFKYGSYNRSFGNEWLGGRVSIHASGRYNRVSPLRQRTATFRLQGTGRFLKQTKSLCRVHASMGVQKTSSGAGMSGNAQIKIDIVGKRVLTREYSGSVTPPNFSRTFKLFPVDPQMSVPVGPFTVTLKGNAGAGVGFNSRLTFYSRMIGVHLGASGNAYASANASASVGIPGVRAGLEADAKLANQTLTAGISVTTGGVAGSLTYVLQAIELKLRAFAKVVFKTWSKTLVTWSAGRYQRNFF